MRATRLVTVLWVTILMILASPAKGDESVLEQADKLIRNRNFYEAVKLLEARHDFTSLRNPDSLSMLGNALMELRFTKRAVRIAKQLIELFPNDPRGYELQAGYMIRYGSAQEAGEFLIDSFKKFPNSLNLQLLYAKSLEYRRKFELVGKVLHPLEKRFPNSASVCMSLANSIGYRGRIMKDQEQLKRAEEYYERAVALDPHNYERIGALGSFLTQLGKNQVAAELYRQAIADNPDVAVYYSSAATTQRRALGDSFRQDQQIWIDRADSLPQICGDFVATYAAMRKIYEVCGETEKVNSTTDLIENRFPDSNEVADQMFDTAMRDRSLTGEERLALSRKCLLDFPDYYKIPYIKSTIFNTLLKLDASDSEVLSAMFEMLADHSGGDIAYTLESVARALIIRERLVPFSVAFLEQICKKSVDTTLGENETIKNLNGRKQQRAKLLRLLSFGQALTGNAPRAEELLQQAEALWELKDKEDLYFEGRVAERANQLDKALDHFIQAEVMSGYVGRVPEGEPKASALRVAEQLAVSEAEAAILLKKRRSEFLEREQKAVLSNLIEEPAPACSVDLLGGGTFKLSEFKGSVVVINYWATWCGYCIAEMPELVEFYNKFKDDPRIEFIAITTDKEIEKVEPFVKENQYPFPIGFDNGCAGAFGVGGIPHTVVVGPEGKIRYRTVGASHTIARDLEWIAGYLLEMNDTTRP